MKAVRFALEYAAIKTLEAVVTFPPLPAALRWGERLGAGLRLLMPKRDRLVTGNISASFPGISSSEVDRIAGLFWRNLGRVAVEFVRSPEVIPDAPDAFDVDNLEVLKSAMAGGRPIIVVAAHFCNWEINGIILLRLIRTLGGSFTAISRPMKNPMASRWVQSKRSTGGMPTILHRQAVKESLRFLRRGESVGALIDQNLYHGGVFVDFFGRPAATTFLPALLHNRTGAPVILTWVSRAGERFRIHFERIELPAEPGDEPLRAWTQIINHRIEAVVRRNPEWWFWIHNRWKRTAEAAAGGTA